MSEFPVEADLTVAGRKVIEALMGYGVEGAPFEDLMVKANMGAKHLSHVLKRQLEPRGFAFNKGKAWVATDAVLNVRFDPKPYIERMRRELVKALFDGWEELPERVKIIFKEFSAAKSLPTPMTDTEALRFAQQRAMKVER